uniref:Uncharacterized protein LOC113793795 n=1 Tax=Dermatophagoides pteronyssinus TaxID=6956 RepID=A0A6P6Y2E9_DERPT|nr:uncharacterized protein LOC113793795 [Dermatophagoides pteronyssinus]
MAKKYKLDQESRNLIKFIHDSLLKMQHELILDPSEVPLQDLKNELIGFRNQLDEIMAKFDDWKKFGKTLLFHVEKITLCHLMINKLWYWKILDDHQIQTMS